MLLGIVIPLIVLVVIVYATTRRRPPQRYRLVPGPKGLPIIGNTLEVPTVHPEKQFKEWAKEFGELYRIQLGWNDWVFVNSDYAVKVSPVRIALMKEIFDKQSAVTSSRPRLPISSDLLSGGVDRTLVRFNRSIASYFNRIARNGAGCER
jgi:hypothetical protein